MATLVRTPLATSPGCASLQKRRRIHLSVAASRRISPEDENCVRVTEILQTCESHQPVATVLRYANPPDPAGATRRLRRTGGLWSRSVNRIEVVIAVAEEARDRLYAVAAVCRALGFGHTSTLTDIGILIGSAEIDDLPTLRAIPGVAAIQLEREFWVRVPG